MSPTLVKPYPDRPDHYRLGVGGATVQFDTIASLTVNCTGGDSSFTVNATIIPTVINGGPYQDAFTINGSTAALTINGLHDSGSRG